MAGARQLTDEAHRAWLALVQAAGRLFEELDASLAEHHDLRLADYEVLWHLGEAERGLRMGDLAERVVFSRSRMTYRVDRLVERGLVLRRACPSDRRGTFAVITAQGRQLLAAARPTHAEGLLTNLFEGLSGADIADLARILCSTPVAQRTTPAVAADANPC